LFQPRQFPPSLNSLTLKVTFVIFTTPFSIRRFHSLRPLVIPLDYIQWQSFTLNRQSCISNNHQEEDAGTVIHLTCSRCTQTSTKQTANQPPLPDPFLTLSHLSEAIVHNQTNLPTKEQQGFSLQPK
jgi:hypothetical protein